MGKATPIILIALAVGGYFAYQKFAAPPSEACQTYQKFGDAMASSRWEEAMGLATKECWAPIQKNVGSRQANMVRSMTKSIAGDVTGVTFDIDSEEPSADGQTVKIKATEHVNRYRPGDRAVGGGSVTNFKHTVEVKKVGAVWRISAFEEVDSNPK